MGWRFDSTAGATIWDTEPMTRDDLALRDEELAWMIREGKRGWKLINGRIAASGEPTNGRRHLRGAGRLSAAGVGGGADVVGDGAGARPVGAHPDLHAAADQRHPRAAGVPVHPVRDLHVGRDVGHADDDAADREREHVAVARRVRGADADGVADERPVLHHGRHHDPVDRAAGRELDRDRTFHALANSAVGGATTSWLWGTGATAVSFDSTIAAGANGGGIWLGVTFSANFPTMTLQQVHLMDWN
jgi:hypothetical protein